MCCDPFANRQPCHSWHCALVAYGQNGEAIRPAQGYPARLFLPGWEGNTNVKWLRRIEITRNTRGKGVYPGREMGKTGALKGLETTTRGLDSDEVR